MSENLKDKDQNINPAELTPEIDEPLEITNNEPEEDYSIVNWISTSAKDIKIKLPTNFDELEKMDNGHEF